MHLIDDKRKLQPTVPPAKFRNLHINHESYTWPQAQHFAVNCGWQIVPEGNPKMERSYNPMTQSSKDQTSDTLAKYISERLNTHNIPLPPDQVYLIAEAIAQDGRAHEASNTLVERLSW